MTLIFLLWVAVTFPLCWGLGWLRRNWPAAWHWTVTAALAAWGLSTVFLLVSGGSLLASVSFVPVMAFVWLAWPAISVWMIRRVVLRMRDDGGNGGGGGGWDDDPDDWGPNDGPEHGITEPASPQEPVRAAGGFCARPRNQPEAAKTPEMML